MIKQSKDWNEFLKKIADFGYEINSGEHKSEILLYEKALANLKKSYSKMPNSKQIFEEFEKLNEKKNTLMQEYSSSKSEMTELYQIRKNYEKYMGKEMEG